MKKNSTNLTKAVFGLLVSLGSNALAQDSVVTTDMLSKNNLEDQIIQELLSEKILLRSHLNDRFRLNNSKVIAVLRSSNDQDLIEFMHGLQSITENDVEINIKKLKEMLLSSQDSGINQ